MSTIKIKKVTMDIQDQVREQLKEYVIRNRIPLTDLAKEIGVAFVTMHRFLTSKHRTQLRTVWIIEKFLKDKQ